MWFEIIPSAAIITVAMSVPYFGLYGLHKVFLGTVSFSVCFDSYIIWYHYRLIVAPWRVTSKGTATDGTED